jgi:hypothetical protein
MECTAQAIMLSSKSKSVIILKQLLWILSFLEKLCKFLKLRK